MNDFAGVMPIITFLNLLGMPESEAPYLLDLAKRLVPGQPEMAAGQAEAHAYIADLIRDRQARPGDDFVSMLVSAQVMGRNLTPTERHNVVQLVVTGGLDTVINTTSFAMNHFARHPELQRDLRDHPELHDAAVDEINRRFGTSNLARLVREDVDFAQVTLRKGDQILGMFPFQASMNESTPIRCGSTRGGRSVAMSTSAPGRTPALAPGSLAVKSASFSRNGSAPCLIAASSREPLPAWQPASSTL